MVHGEDTERAGRGKSVEPASLEGQRVRDRSSAEHNASDVSR